MVMSKNDNKKILAFQTPEHLHNYLTLYTYQRGFTKSRVLKQALSSWYLEASKLYPEKDLLKQILNDIQGRWDCFKAGCQSEDKGIQNLFAEFKHHVSTGMREKNIQEEVILQLLNSIEI